MVTQEGFEPPTFWFVAKHSDPAELLGHLRGGQGWIRTIVAVTQRVYSPSPLATRAPTHYKILEQAEFGGPTRTRT